MPWALGWAAPTAGPPPTPSTPPHRLVHCLLHPPSSRPAPLGPVPHAVDRTKRPVDIPFELAPESEAEALRYRLAVQKREERLALRARMRRRKKIRVSLDGGIRDRWGGAGSCPAGRCLSPACLACFSTAIGACGCVYRGVPPALAAPSCWAMLGCRSDSESDDDETEVMRQALTATSSSASEDTGRVGHPA